MGARPVFKTVAFSSSHEDNVRFYRFACMFLCFGSSLKKLWHNRRSFRVVLRLWRHMLQWNGAAQSESDSKSTAFFHRAVPVAAAAPQNAPRSLRLLRIQIFRSLKTRNADHAKRSRQ
ncbi:hypothetical protein IQ289_04625 [Burkholderia sp. R-70006]|uniref:hypothetical protein n=1 Tax=Paraburkholderia domus TaxID=2793075 RepID=UPI001914A137|nr:hypothetical protein [Paraburkholderia domus]MBK5047685.1 hypothetical protein [Burkholderia sp. R-70006]